MFYFTSKVQSQMGKAVHLSQMSVQEILSLVQLSPALSSRYLSRASDYHEYHVGVATPTLQVLGWGSGDWVP